MNGVERQAVEHVTATIADAIQAGAVGIAVLVILALIALIALGWVFMRNQTSTVSSLTAVLGSTSTLAEAQVRKQTAIVEALEKQTGVMDQANKQQRDHLVLISDTLGNVNTSMVGVSTDLRGLQAAVTTMSDDLKRLNELVSMRISDEDVKQSIQVLCSRFEESEQRIVSAINALVPAPAPPVVTIPTSEPDLEPVP